jgi:hypothetical protein
MSHQLGVNQTHMLMLFTRVLFVVLQSVHQRLATFRPVLPMYSVLYVIQTLHPPELL